MRRFSEKTFEAEGSSFRNIPGIFWESEREYPVDPFSGFIDTVETEDTQGKFGDTWVRGEYPTLGPDSRIRDLGQRGLVYLDRTEVMEHICDAAGRSDADFAEAFWDALGIDIFEELKSRENADRPTEGELRNLTAKFGTEAFGSYCPWHAFGRSAETPWGIYMFLEKLMDWAALLHQSGNFLPNPKPPFSWVLRMLWVLTYRHEQFHFEVELYATRLESALRRPIYRPYVERVRGRVAKTDQWWEEALAQAVVLESKSVKRTLGIDAQYMKSHIVPYFRTFPEGYKRFECKGVSGGVDGAHRLLSAQIARAKIEISEEERNTDMSLAKREYSTRKDAVPGYLVFSPEAFSRFQLQTPRLKDVIRHIRRLGGEVDDHAPGDHKRAKLNGQRFQLNAAKRGDSIDLASAKDLAKVLGIKVGELNRAIA